MGLAYLAVLINSTIRSTTPVLLAALGSAICSQSGVFNIALEGQMLIASFAAIAVNYLTGSLLLSVLAGVLSGTLIGVIVAVLQVKYNAADMVIGTSVNLLVGGLTSILLFLVMGVKGGYNGSNLISLEKISLPVIGDVPFLGRMLEDLTIIDYVAYIIAIILFLYLYRTVSGFRVTSVGINREAAESLGIRAIRTRMAMVILSGALCGLGGTVLSIGQVTLFTEGMTAGRGFIAMAAASMGMNHPLFIVASSLFFGFAQAFGASIQNVVPSQLTMTVPYIATIAALAVFSNKTNRTRFTRVSRKKEKRV